MAARALENDSSTNYMKHIGHGTFTLNNNDLTEDLAFSSNMAWVGKYSIPVSFNVQMSSLKQSLTPLIK